MVSRLNREWHEANPMPKNPTPEQRMAWHTGHATNCACRAMPAGVIRLFTERGLPVPEQKALLELVGRKS
jgi:hypothetical protein